MMTPMFLNHNNTEYFDLNQAHSHEDQRQQVLESSPFYTPFASSSISSLQLEQGLGMSAAHSMSDHQSLAFDHLEGSKNTLYDMVSPPYGAQITSTNNHGSQNHEISIFKQQEDQEPNNQYQSGGITTDNNGSSLRWMSSKMRMMRRMINSNDTKTGPRIGSRIIAGTNNPDHGPQLNNNVSSDINTTTMGFEFALIATQQGLLYGAVALKDQRQRKARKAAMEAAAAATAATNSSCEATSSSTSSKTTIKLKINKEKNKSRATSYTCVSQHINKKQTTCNKQQTNTQLVDSDHTNNSSTSSSSKRQMFFEQFAVNLLSKNAAFHRMFPQDEEEGALLLMALSYGFTES